jgi:hypothetical protein
MSNNFKKILYLGAWEHIEIVDYFPNCNEFILIDTQPRSEHDEKDYFYDGFYRRTFLDTLITKCINKTGCPNFQATNYSFMQFKI